MSESSTTGRGPPAFPWIKGSLTLLGTLALCIGQTACQPSRTSDRLIVASAGRISALDPARANTFGALQLLSAIGDTLYKRSS
ncbi:ABC transporter substrate-binding protein, partial [Pseudomonas sp. HMWF031]